MVCKGQLDLEVYQVQWVHRVCLDLLEHQGFQDFWGHQALQDPQVHLAHLVKVITFQIQSHLMTTWCEV